MKYTENNIIGLEVIHQDGYSKYRIIKTFGKWISTINLDDQTQEDVNWATIDDVNRWLETGTWSLLTTNYEIY